MFQSCLCHFWSHPRSPQRYTDAACLPSLVGRPSSPLPKYLKWQVRLFSCQSSGRNWRDRHSSDISTGEPEECRGLRTRCRSVFTKCLQWFIFPEPVFIFTAQTVMFTLRHYRSEGHVLNFHFTLYCYTEKIYLTAILMTAYVAD